MEWCLWESAIVGWSPSTGLDDRFRDAAIALAFARLATHHVRHDAWIEDGSLLRQADSLANIRGILVNGRFDLQSPLGNAWELLRVWPRAELSSWRARGTTATTSTSRAS